MPRQRASEQVPKPWCCATRVSIDCAHCVLLVNVLINHRRVRKAILGVCLSQYAASLNCWAQYPKQRNQSNVSPYRCSWTKCHVTINCQTNAVYSFSRRKPAFFSQGETAKDLARLTDISSKYFERIQIIPVHDPAQRSKWLFNWWSLFSSLFSSLCCSLFSDFSYTESAVQASRTVHYAMSRSTSCGSPCSCTWYPTVRSWILGHASNFGCVHTLANSPSLPKTYIGS